MRTYQPGNLPEDALEAIVRALEAQDAAQPWHPSAEELQDWEDGYASEEDAECVIEHLARCPRCRNILMVAAELDDAAEDSLEARQPSSQPGTQAARSRPTRESAILHAMRGLRDVVSPKGGYHPVPAGASLGQEPEPGRERTETWACPALSWVAGLAPTVHRRIWRSSGDPSASCPPPPRSCSIAFARSRVSSKTHSSPLSTPVSSNLASSLAAVKTAHSSALVCWDAPMRRKAILATRSGGSCAPSCFSRRRLINKLGSIRRSGS